MSSSNTPGPRIAARSGRGDPSRSPGLGIAALGAVAVGLLVAPLYGPAQQEPSGVAGVGEDTTPDQATTQDTAPVQAAVGDTMRARDTIPPRPTGEPVLPAQTLAPEDTASGQTARQERCDLMENEFVRSIATAAGGRIIYVSGPVLFVCEDGTRIRADSAVQYTSTQFRELIGSVEIDGPDTRVTADRVHVSAESGRTQAWGGVRVVEKGADMRMTGDTLVFLEAGRFRERDELRMWGDRPYAVIRMEGDPAPDTTTPPEELPERIVIGREEPEEPVDTVTEPEPPPPPDTVFGDRLYMQGRSRFQAAGSVEVRRSDLEAYGDSLDYDRALSRALLLGRDSMQARIDGQEFDLTGHQLRLLIQGSRIEEVRADGEARLTGEEVRIDAPRIFVFLSRGEIDRLVAIRSSGGEEARAADSAAAPRRAEAHAEEFFLRADSIEVQAPEQVLDQVVAVGGARGEARGRDSLEVPDDTLEVLQRDWIEGDTVVAHFLPPDSVPSASPGEQADSAAARSRLDRLVAIGSARSLYRIVRPDSVAGEAGDSAAAPDPESGGPEASAPEQRPPRSPVDTAASFRSAAADSADTGGRLAIHYVVGDRITIVLRQGEVERMEVEGRTRGLYLEPRGPRRAPPRPDTAPEAPVAGDDGPPDSESDAGRRGEA